MFYSIASRTHKTNDQIAFCVCLREIVLWSWKSCLLARGWRKHDGKRDKTDKRSERISNCKSIDQSAYLYPILFLFLLRILSLIGRVETSYICVSIIKINEKKKELRLDLYHRSTIQVVLSILNDCLLASSKQTNERTNVAAAVVATTSIFHMNRFGFRWKLYAYVFMCVLCAHQRRR